MGYADTNLSQSSVIQAYTMPKVLTGTATISDAAQTETSAFAILTITPPAGVVLNDVEIILDLAKATNGFAAVESTITAQFALSRKIDGTNWRREAYNEAALSGTNAANRAQRLVAGTVGPQGVRVEAVFSADITADIAVPYVVHFRGSANPTIS